MAEEEEGGQQEERKGKGSKKILLIAVAVVVLLAGGVGASCSCTTGSRRGSHPTSPDPQEMERLIKDHPIITLKPFVVNLSGPAGSSPQYLKVRIALKVDRAVTAKEIDYRLPEIQSAILILLGAQTTADIQSTGGKLALKDEIRHRINARLDSGKVTDVYFTEFVIQ